MSLANPAADPQDPWEYSAPSVLFSLIYILSVVLCFAVGIMLSWHLFSICKAETSVESHDHSIYRKLAKERGQVRISLHFNATFVSLKFVPGL